MRSVPSKDELPFNTSILPTRKTTSLSSVIESTEPRISKTSTQSTTSPSIRFTEPWQLSALMELSASGIKTREQSWRVRSSWIKASQSARSVQADTFSRMLSAMTGRRWVTKKDEKFWKYFHDFSSGILTDLFSKHSLIFYCLDSCQFSRFIAFPRLHISSKASTSGLIILFLSVFTF